jgi:putative chitinase
MPLTVDALTLVGCDRAKAQEHLPHITGAMLAHDISTPPRARFFLAQALHECGLLRWMEEIWGPNQWQRTYDGRLGNNKPGDGFRYRGRGPFMLTGRGNYRTFGGKLARPYENDPDVVARPADGWLVAARYWNERSLSACADRGDARAITRGINGAATDGAPSHHLHRMAIYTRLPADCTPVRPDPYRCLTAQERDVIEALDMERRCAKRNGGWEHIDPSHLRHAQQLKAQLVDLRKAIWRAAEAEKPNGWDVKRRRDRFDVLKKATAA